MLGQVITNDLLLSSQLTNAILQTKYHYSNVFATRDNLAIRNKTGLFCEKEETVQHLFFLNVPWPDKFGLNLLVL